MKRRYLALLLTLVLVMSLLTGCGGSAKTEAFSNGMDAAAPEDMWVESPAEAPEAEAGGLTNAYGGASNANVEQKLIIRADIQAETEDLESLLNELNTQIARLGGYTERQELNNGSAYSSHRYRSAWLTVRIPADKLKDFTAQVEGQSNVVSYTETSDDVTLTYVDTQSRMTALQTEQERLLELLSQAENMKDLLEIEARLTEVRYELESVTSRLRVLDNQVDYATVTLYIEQVKVYTDVQEPETVWQRITKGFTGNLKDIWDEAVDLFVWIVTYSPQLLLLAAFAALLILLGKRWKKRRKTRYQPQTPKPRPETPENQN